jgi:hypothetical protein
MLVGNIFLGNFELGKANLTQALHHLIHLDYFGITDRWEASQARGRRGGV